MDEFIVIVIVVIVKLSVQAVNHLFLLFLFSLLIKGTDNRSLHCVIHSSKQYMTTKAMSIDSIEWVASGGILKDALVVHDGHVAVNFVEESKSSGNIFEFLLSKVKLLSQLESLFRSIHKGIKEDGWFKEGKWKEEGNCNSLPIQHFLGSENGLSGNLSIIFIVIPEKSM